MPANNGDHPLAGVTVLDLGQIYQGPYAGFLCAMAGADVIKVEPRAGDPTRGISNGRGKATYAFATLNANKRSVTLDLKSDAGRDLLIRLAECADVLLENYAPGVMDRLGVGADVLQAANPRLVFASGTGYGQTGPDHDKLAMDLTIQAYSGVMSLTGLPDGPPTKANIAFVDFLGGVHLYAGIVTALLERERTGVGRRVDTAMADAVFPTLATVLGGFFARGDAPRVGNKHGALAVAPYDTYPCKDGHIALLVINEGHWHNLLDAMGRPELADDPRFATNKDRAAHMAETDAVVTEWTMTQTRDDAARIIAEHHIPVAPVRAVAEVVEDPHLHERGTLQRIDHPDVGDGLVVHGTPLRFAGLDPLPLELAPPLGAHNDEVYGKLLGLDRSELAALRAAEVI